MFTTHNVHNTIYQKMEQKYRMYLFSSLSISSQLYYKCTIQTLQHTTHHNAKIAPRPATPLRPIKPAQTITHRPTSPPLSMCSNRAQHTIQSLPALCTTSSNILIAIFVIVRSSAFLPPLQDRHCPASQQLCRPAEPQT